MLDGTLIPFGDDDDLRNRNVTMSPSLAQLPRDKVTIDGAEFPCVKLPFADAVLVVDSGTGQQIQHVLPPAPRVDDPEQDREATRLHGALVPLAQYWNWIAKLEKP